MKNMGLSCLFHGETTDKGGLGIMNEVRTANVELVNDSNAEHTLNDKNFREELRLILWIVSEEKTLSDHFQDPFRNKLNSNFSSPKRAT